ncbi:hypothetical protein [Pseudonocardia sp. T1-2H]|uniref:hypothetical protein n=1 Tax=Pseudonocardia sp. T1-2H TaxID=3128899 RepID=UPI0031010980
MTVRVVGIHGIGNCQAGRTPDDAAAILGRRWTPAVRQGLGTGSQVEAVVAYYAHHLAGDTAQGVGDPAQLTDPEQQLLLGWAHALGAPTEVAQGRLTQPARAAANWIAKEFGLDHALVRLLVATSCREVNRYLTDPDRRAAVRDTVADTIGRERPRVVLAHSLGSVVAYETLWARADLEV